MGEHSTPDAQVETSASTRERDNGTSRVTCVPRIW